jgi:hypothetical protein
MAGFCDDGVERSCYNASKRVHQQTNNYGLAAVILFVVRMILNVTSQNRRSVAGIPELRSCGTDRLTSLKAQPLPGANWMGHTCMNYSLDECAMCARKHSYSEKC